MSKTNTTKLNKASTLKAIERIENYWKARGKKVKVGYKKVPVRSGPDGSIAFYDFPIVSNIRVTYHSPQ